MNALAELAERLGTPSSDPRVLHMAIDDEIRHIPHGDHVGAALWGELRRCGLTEPLDPRTIRVLHAMRDGRSRWSDLSEEERRAFALPAPERRYSYGANEGLPPWAEELAKSAGISTTFCPDEYVRLEANGVDVQVEQLFGASVTTYSVRVLGPASSSATVTIDIAGERHVLTVEGDEQAVAAVLQAACDNMRDSVPATAERKNADLTVRFYTRATLAAESESNDAALAAAMRRLASTPTTQLQYDQAIEAAHAAHEEQRTRIARRALALGRVGSLKLERARLQLLALVYRSYHERPLRGVERLALWEIASGGRAVLDARIALSLVLRSVDTGADARTAALREVLEFLRPGPIVRTAFRVRPLLRTFVVPTRAGGEQTQVQFATGSSRGRCGYRFGRDPTPIEAPLEVIEEIRRDPALEEVLSADDFHAVTVQRDDAMRELAEARARIAELEAQPRTPARKRTQHEEQ